MLWNHTLFDVIYLFIGTYAKPIDVFGASLDDKEKARYYVQSIGLFFLLIDLKERYRFLLKLKINLTFYDELITEASSVTEITTLCYRYCQPTAPHSLSR